MPDYNISEYINNLIDTSVVKERAKEKPRQYLGASRLGVECARALQYEAMKVPPDEGRDFNGKILRIFEMGHAFEAMMLRWLNLAGFVLMTYNKIAPLKFEAANGLIQGHVDGVFVTGPRNIGITYPALWECKALNNKSWNDTKKRQLTLSKPVYAAQIALYQAYLEPSIPNISKNPALFTALNKDSGEIYTELVPFNTQLAQESSDKGVKILQACAADEVLPREYSDPNFYKCKMCAWHDKCWENWS